MVRFTLALLLLLVPVGAWALPLEEAPRAVRPAPQTNKAPSSKTSRLEAEERRLLRIQQRITEISGRLAQSKVRLLTWRGEPLIGNVFARGWLQIRSLHKLPATFVLKRQRVFIDGRVHSTGPATDVLYDGNVIPGHHSVTVEQVWGLRSSVFTYVKGHTVTLKQAFTFYAAKGRKTRVTLRTVDRGAFVRTTLDRPTLRMAVEKLPLR